jgi:hypothetical protein
MTRQRLVPTMPPLLAEEIDMNNLTGDKTHSCSSKFAGNSAELIVKAWFLKNHINVAEPNVDDGVDLLIEREPNHWVRGQVKKVVYTNKLDSGMYKRNGEKVYRSRFNFPFQSGAAITTTRHINARRRQRTIDEIDYFYHVLHTTERTLLWEIPASIVPLRKNSREFVFAKNPCIDRDTWIRRKSDFSFSDYLLFSQFSRKVIESYPDFFIKPEIGTLELIL